MRVHFAGPLQYRLRSLAVIAQSVAQVSARRALNGPCEPGWGWDLEVRTEVLKRQLQIAFAMDKVEDARAYLDTIVTGTPELSRVRVTPLNEPNFRGYWCIPEKVAPERIALYLHGGGYSFYPRSYAGVVALIARATKSKTLALDYPLAPEHRFPAQLQDAMAAYRWLLQAGTDVATLVLAGDSAGGNLALALLLAIRDARLPMPALAVLLSPATDFRLSSFAPATCEWIGPSMLANWANWFCGPEQRCDPLISPVCADLRELPPLYVQAGRAEILYQSIRAFVHCARGQVVDVQLDSWEGMNHDFQIFGSDIPQCADALRRLGAVVDSRLRARSSVRTSSAPDRG